MPRIIVDVTVVVILSIALHFCNQKKEPHVCKMLVVWAKKLAMLQNLKF